MLERAKNLMNLIKREVVVYQKVLRHPRTPWHARIVLGLALAYLVSPIDLIPDPIPVLGQLDDLLIVPGLVTLAVKLIPAEVIAECRAHVDQESSANPLP